jgi:hypothetical protein
MRRNNVRSECNVVEREEKQQMTERQEAGERERERERERESSKRFI